MALNTKPQRVARGAPLKLLRRNASSRPQESERLWAAVYLPQLPLDVLNPGAKPSVCSIEKQGRSLVWVANASASESGVQAGMTVSAARALEPNLSGLVRQPHLEAEATEALALKLYNLSAWVHIAHPNMLLLELKASLKLFGGLEPLLTALKALLKPQCSVFSIAVAPTPSAAMLLARAGDEEPLLNVGQTAGRLARIPLMLMAETEPQWFARLQKLGLRHYGELLRLPRDGLQKRFGKELTQYLQQLQDQRLERPAAWQPPSRYESKQELTEELSHSSELSPALFSMVEALCSWLQQRAARVQRFSIELLGHKQLVAQFDVSFLRPGNSAEAMQKLLALRLEREVLAAPVAGLVIRAEHIIYPQKFTVGQQRLWNDQDAEDDSWWECLEAIQARLGAGSVTAIASRDEHRPERAWKNVLPGEAGDVQACNHKRPLWLFEKPKRLTASEQRQLCLHSRPERITSGWWDRDLVYRDYFVAQVGPQQLWVFRNVNATPSQWFCHGVFH